MDTSRCARSWRRRTAMTTPADFAAIRITSCRNQLLYTKNVDENRVPARRSVARLACDSNAIRKSPDPVLFLLTFGRDTSPARLAHMKSGFGRSPDFLPGSQPERLRETLKKLT